MATTVKHRVEYVVFKGLFLSTRLMPRFFLLWCGRMLGFFVGRIVGFRRGIILDNLHHAFPEKDRSWHRATAQAFYRHLGMTLMEFLASGHRSPADLEKTVQLDGWENVSPLLEAGQGVVFLSGHFGNFELILPWAAAARIPAFGVAKPQRNKLIDKFHNSLRAREGVGIIPTGGSVPRLLKVLEEGKSVGLLGDQDAGGKGLFVEFMNRPASVHQGPARLAVNSGCPVVMVFMHRQPDHSHVLKILPPIMPDPQLDTKAAVQELTRRHTALLEEVIRSQPEMYYWIHRRWKTRPPAETSGN